MRVPPSSATVTENPLFFRAPIWTGERGSGGAGGSATAAAGMPEQSAEPPAKQRATETNEQWSAATNDAGKNAEARDASPDRQPGPEVNVTLANARVSDRSLELGGRPSRPGELT